MNRIFGLFFVILLFSGCVIQSKHLTQSYTSSHFPLELVSFPALGDNTKVEIGQSIVSTANKRKIPAIKLKNTIVHNYDNFGDNIEVTLPEGVYIARGKSKDGVFYQAKNKISQTTTKGSYEQVGGIFIYNDKSKSPEMYLISRGQPLNDPIKEEVYFDSTTVDEWSEGSFKRELVYSGKSKGSINILYREFKDDMARPAFSQLIQYDLSEDGLIGFRGARFQVIKADNISIRYKVLKHID